MPKIERTADVVWEGSTARGQGLISAGSSAAFTDLPYSLPTRIGQAAGKTSPEELLAAAHGACLAMSLASELGSLGHPPQRLEVACRIVMDEVEGQGHQIVASHVTISAAAPGIDAAALAEAASAAHEGCPFSALLERAGATVEVDARLA